MYLLLLSAFTAIAAALLVSPEDWAANRAAMLVAFGIQGAAILTRLGRGHPVSDINHLTNEQLDHLNKAVQKIANEQKKAAQITFVATLLTIGATGLNSVLHAAFKEIIVWIPKADGIVSSFLPWIWPIIVAVSAFLVVAAFSFLPAILKQDVDLIALQGTFKLDALKKAQEKSAKEKSNTERTISVLSEIHRAVENEDTNQAAFGRIRPRGKVDD